jgi:hypothetical protein
MVASGKPDLARQEFDLMKNLVEELRLLLVGKNEN